MLPFNFTNFQTKITDLFFLIFIIMGSNGCVNNNQDAGKEQPLANLIVLDPGHFHAALLQKSMNKDVDSNVHVFAPEGPDVKAHLALIDGI